MKRLLLTLLLTAAVPFARATPPQCLFQTYSTLDGMTHDRIADIYTDSRGFVWVCTWYGVSRFDGYTFKNFSTTPGDFSPLSHHRFISVSEDSNGHLWFTTYNFHVYRLNRYTEQFEDVVSLVGGRRFAALPYDALPARRPRQYVGGHRRVGRGAFQRRRRRLARAYRRLFSTPGAGRRRDGDVCR